MNLDLSSFRNAVGSLRRALQVADDGDFILVKKQPSQFCSKASNGSNTGGMILPESPFWIMANSTSIKPAAASLI